MWVFFSFAVFGALGALRALAAQEVGLWGFRAQGLGLGGSGGRRWGLGRGAFLDARFFVQTWTLMGLGEGRARRGSGAWGIKGWGSSTELRMGFWFGIWGE